VPNDFRSRNLLQTKAYPIDLDHIVVAPLIVESHWLTPWIHDVRFAQRAAVA